MPKWNLDKREYEFTPPGARQNTEVVVSAAYDPEGVRQNQFIIEDSPENRGRSIFEPGVLNKCIESLSEAIYEMDPEKREFFEIDPTKQQWHVRANDGQLYSVDVAQEEKMVKHSQFEWLENTGEMSRADEKEARKHYQDERATVLTTSLDRLEEHEEHEVNEVFKGLEKEEPLMYRDGPERDETSSHEFDLSDHKMSAPSKEQESAHEIDLSQEQF